MPPGSSPFHVKEFVGTINDQPWGDTFYVSSTHNNAGDDNLGKYPRQPLKTLVKALANCADGDRIIIGPNHVETITAAKTFTDADVRIIGLGQGNARPAFTFTTVVESGFTFSGSNVLLEDLRFLCGIDAQTLVLGATGAGCKMLGCEFTHSGAVQPLVACYVNGACSEVAHCTGLFLATGMNTLLQFGSGADGIHVHDCHFHAFCATAVIENTAAAADNVLIERNALSSLNSTAKPCILLVSLTTGQVRWNTLRLTQDAQTGWIDTPGKTSLYENYGVNNDGETGILAGTPTV